MDTTAKEVIKIRELYKSFGENHVLRGVDLDVGEKENVVVLGRSGTGKSVLIKIIAGLLKPDSGLVKVLGEEVDSLKGEELRQLRLKIGFSFQNSALYDSMTVQENLRFPLVRNMKHLGKQQINESVERVLDAVGLSQTIKQMPAELSGGQRKRIGIARTLILNPEIMLYDEPTAGLDPITCIEINNLINEVKARFNTSAIVITHDLTCAKATGDRVAMMMEGKFIKLGSFEEVFSSPDERIKNFYNYNFYPAGMSTENNRKGVIVGLFVFFGILIIIVAVLTLGGQKKTFVKAIHVNAQFKDVNGLAVGNNIWFSGVKIGTIKSINFAPDASVVVTMNVEEKVKRYIHLDSKAKIGSDGLIGNKIVVIYGGSATSPEIQENSTLAVESALDPEQIMTTLQANNKNLLAITGDFKLISERLASGKGSVGKLLTDESVFNDLTAAMTSLKNATVHANTISNDLAGYTARLKTKGSLADDLVSDTVLFSNLRSTVSQMNEAAVKANGIVDNLSHVSNQFSNSKTPIGALLNDENAANDLKNTLKNLSSGTAKLDDNMEALQHNFLLRGFFRKKAKQAANK